MPDQNLSKEKGREIMIYVAEDDQSIRDLILYTLHASGYRACGFADGRQLLMALKENLEKPSLILLDIMMPDEDGISVLKRIRSNPDTQRIPIIMESAKSTEFDTVSCLDLGADDYLCKPFGMMEMVSRIRAVLRRSTPLLKDDQISFGPLLLNCREHTVTINQKPVVLTRKEYDLLKLLMRNPRYVFSREELLIKIWDTDFAGESRTVDVHINTLRSKLSEASSAIQTVRGVGYRFDPRVFEQHDSSGKEETKS
ncbi:winged helix-turn-helix domain-containing protein [Ileibacterium valens]|uniref:winged helix-turn-helix domain-containing protein n=1 Tax=Ileibacterium valens TaxID=1862668 RepID=UPI002352A7A1|nr:response regulator transcription factor [Ileibacterium valens]